MIGIILI